MCVCVCVYVSCIKKKVWFLFYFIYVVTIGFSDSRCTAPHINSSFKILGCVMLTRSPVVSLQHLAAAGESSARWCAGRVFPWHTLSKRDESHFTILHSSAAHQMCISHLYSLLSSNFISFSDLLLTPDAAWASFSSDSAHRAWSVCPKQTALFSAKNPSVMHRAKLAIWMHWHFNACQDEFVARCICICSASVQSHIFAIWIKQSSIWTGFVLLTLLLLQVYKICRYLERINFFFTFYPITKLYFKPFFQYFLG